MISAYEARLRQYDVKENGKSVSPGCLLRCNEWPSIFAEIIDGEDLGESEDDDDIKLQDEESDESDEVPDNVIAAGMLFARTPVYNAIL